MEMSIDRTNILLILRSKLLLAARSSQQETEGHQLVKCDLCRLRALMELFYEHSNTCLSATSCSRLAASRRYLGVAFHHPRGDAAPWLQRSQHDRASKIVRAFAIRRTPFVISFSLPANSTRLL